MRKMTIGHKIALKRVSLSMTQEQLAFKCGVGRLQITKLESDVDLPSIFLLTKIANALGMLDIIAALKIILK